MLPPHPRHDDLPVAARHALTAGLVAAHVWALWWLVQAAPARDSAVVAPLQVQWIAPPAPSAPPPPAPPPTVPAPAPRTRPIPRPPDTAAVAAERAAQPSDFAVPPAPPAELPTPPTPPVTEAAPAAPSMPATPPAAPPAAPQHVPPSALRYRVGPAVAFPPASRRLGESGSVWLRVVVGIDGVPHNVSVLRSSGFARLDQQALEAMRRARFHPCTRDGVAFECESSAQIDYQLEN